MSPGSTPRRPRRNLVWLFVAFAVATVACGSDNGGGGSLAGAVREPTPNVATISLPEATASGAPMSFVAKPGGLLLVYFGYLSCPDVCPTTMADIRTALGKLSTAERNRVEVVMVTIDPERDSPTSLTSYVRTFVTDGRAARTDDPTALRAAANAFGADYSVTKSASGETEVGHTAFIYAVDDHGGLRVTWPFGMKAPEIRSDIQRLLASSTTTA